MSKKVKKLKNPAICIKNALRRKIEEFLKRVEKES